MPAQARLTEVQDVAVAIRKTTRVLEFVAPQAERQRDGRLALPLQAVADAYAAAHPGAPREEYMVALEAMADIDEVELASDARIYFRILNGG